MNTVFVNPIKTIIKELYYKFIQNWMRYAWVVKEADERVTHRYSLWIHSRNIHHYMYSHTTHRCLYNWHWRRKEWIRTHLYLIQEKQRNNSSTYIPILTDNHIINPAINCYINRPSISPNSLFYHATTFYTIPAYLIIIFKDIKNHQL